MLKILNISVGIIGAAFITAGAAGIVRAATLTPPKDYQAINRYVYDQEKLTAVAQVLHTSTYKVDQSYKDNTFNRLVKKQNLTLEQLGNLVKKKLASDLVAKGYTSNQASLAIKIRGLGGSL